MLWNRADIGWSVSGAVLGLALLAVAGCDGDIWRVKM
jgi:hypothetical protein